MQYAHHGDGRARVAIHDHVRAGDIQPVGVRQCGTEVAEIRMVGEPSQGRIELVPIRGLAMAYGFLKQSGGHITIYSEIGHGTTVKLYLRATLTLLADERLPDAVRTTSGGSETILLVEDDAGVRQYAVSQLRSAGYTVLEACDGNAALAFIRERADIRLLFTDIVMPGGLSGREMAQLALGMRPDLKVLYTSGYTENAMAHHGRLDPGLDLLATPYPRAELFYRVRKALDRQTAGE